MRSTDVPPISAEDDDDILVGGSDSDSVHAMENSTSRSHVAQNILGQNVLATQQSQANAAQILPQSSDHKYQVANGKLREALKIVEDDPVQYQRLLDAIDKIRKDGVVRAVAARAALSKDTDESTDAVTYGRNPV
jgi:Ser/Thr protein kinase RdoA (MazF antagonist)